MLLSDGLETQGSAVSQAMVARELGAPIDVVTLPSAAQGPDALVEAVVAPPEVEAFQPFDLKVQIRSPAPSRGRLLLYRDELLLGELPVELEAGLDVVTIPQKLDEAGLHRYRAALEVDGDAEHRNNQARTSIHVDGKPRVLLLEGYEGASEHLKAALEQASFEVRVGGVGDVPETLGEMAPFDVILLSDIPATELGRLQMTALGQFVTDLGKGLIMIGGDRSFGVGGYYKTPIEAVLPVSMTREAKKEMPSQGMVLAIDKSGSMGGFAGASKIALAKEAAVFVVELLTSRDELGVLGFDGSASWVLPYDRLEDKPEAIRRIGTLRAGGGTSIYNALRTAFRGIQGGSAAIKHIILISDGIAENSDLPALARDIRQASVTLTTVAIGTDSDRYTMETLARIGGGRYYETDSPEAIPQIFTRETMMASRSFIMEKEFVPEVVDPSEVMAGIDATPPLKGYVATSIKPRATLALQSPEDDPILAHWRAGLGKSLAFTSDAKGRWGSHWLSDPALFNRFWGQAVRWTAQTGSNKDLAVITSLKGGRLSIVVDSMNEEEYVSGADTQAIVIAPDGRRKQVQLQQVAPGRYRAQIQASEEGTWYVSVQQTLGDQELGRAVREVHRAWSPEFAPSHTGTPVLQELASSTGGRLDVEPAAVWTRPDTPLTTPTSVVPWLLIAMSVLWVLDIAYRRFEGFRAPTRHPAPAPIPRRPGRAARRTSQPRYTPGLGQAAPTDAAVEPPPDDPPPEGPPPPEEPERFSSRLLDAKRKRRKK